MICTYIVLHPVLNTLRPKQNGRHFPDNILRWIFLHEYVWILIKISSKVVPRCPIYNIPALVQIMTWCRSGTSHYLNQWCLDDRRIYAPPGLNKLKYAYYVNIPYCNRNLPKSSATGTTLNISVVRLRDGKTIGVSYYTAPKSVIRHGKCLYNMTTVLMAVEYSLIITPESHAVTGY